MARPGLLVSAGLQLIWRAPAWLSHLGADVLGAASPAVSPTPSPSSLPSVSTPQAPISSQPLAVENANITIFSSCERAGRFQGLDLWVVSVASGLMGWAATVILRGYM